MDYPAGVPRRAQLTKKDVDRWPHAAVGQYIVRDDELPGFFVVVGKKAKTYTIQVDVRSLGKARSVRKIIGRHPDWDAGQARQQARAELGALQTGAKTPVSARGAITLHDAWSRHRAHLERLVATGERSQRTLDGYDDCIERLLKDWRDTSLRDLSDQSIKVAEKHAEITAKHGPYAANHAMRALRATYRYALKKQLDRGLPLTNPVASVDFNTEHRRKRVVARSALAGWHKQLRALGSPVREEFHMFMLLSGSRPDALKKARWEHLDLKRRVLHMPKPKGGTKKAFDIPLSRAMVRCLWRARAAGRKLYPVHAKTWIFVGEKGHIAETKERRDAIERDGKKVARARLSHWGGDLRQTYLTACTDLGLSDMDRHFLANHAFQNVNAGYVVRDALLDHLLAEQERVSRYLVEAMAHDRPNTVNAGTKHAVPAKRRK